MHDYHEKLPGYHPDQMLHDGCRECEARSESRNHGIGALDAGNFERAWRRAAVWNRCGAQAIADARRAVGGAVPAGVARHPDRSGAVVNLYIGYGAVLLLLAGYIAWALRRLRRTPVIDMTGLTVDRDGATVEETLQRVERLQVDPSKLSTAEIQRAHRTLAQDMATRPAGLYVPPWWGDR